MTFIRSLRESWKRILIVIKDSIPIIVIILSYIVFFTLVGYIWLSSKTHNEYRDPAEYFKTIPITMFNMIILFTTSNFPDILFPFFKVSNATAIYFIGFLMIGLYMLLNLMLAVFYNSYKQQIERNIHKYDSVREEFLRNEF